MARIGGWGEGTKYWVAEGERLAELVCVREVGVLKLLGGPAVIRAGFHNNLA